MPLESASVICKSENFKLQKPPTLPTETPSSDQLSRSICAALQDSVDRHDGTALLLTGSRDAPDREAGIVVGGGTHGETMTGVCTFPEPYLLSLHLASSSMLASSPVCLCNSSRGSGVWAAVCQGWDTPAGKCGTHRRRRKS